MKENEAQSLTDLSEATNDLITLLVFPIFKKVSWGFPGSQRAQVQSLTRELRSHMPHSVAK